MDKDTLTIILAKWGAVVSTVAIIWNIYNSLKDKGKLKVDCYIGNQVISGTGLIKERLLVWNITNVGKREIVISHIGGKLTNSDFILTTRNSMPYKLQPGEYIIEYSNDLSILNDAKLKLLVLDTLGNSYSPKRKRLLEAKKKYIRKDSIST
jgi:hypothetical protein